MDVAEINAEIKNLQATDNVSDGFHTFGELYDHRITLFIALCKWILLYEEDTGNGGPEVWKSKVHSDGSMFSGWFIAGIGADKGKQITYHLPMSRWDELDVPNLPEAPEWDGHTPAEALERIKKYVY